MTCDHVIIELADPPASSINRSTSNGHLLRLVDLVHVVDLDVLIIFVITWDAALCALCFISLMSSARKTSRASLSDAAAR